MMICSVAKLLVGAVSVVYPSQPIDFIVNKYYLASINGAAYHPRTECSIRCLVDTSRNVGGKCGVELARPFGAT